MTKDPRKKIIEQIKDVRSGLDDNLKDNLWQLYPHTFAQVISQKSPDGEVWKPYWYLKAISKEIVKAIAEPGHTGILISMPARHGKSTLCSYYTPLWFMNLFPGQKVAISTYSDDFSSHWGEKVRDQIKSNPLLEEMYLKQGSKAKSEFKVKYNNTRKESAFLAVGTGGGFSGRGYNLGIIDDALKNWEDSRSPRIREINRNWFESVYASRKETPSVSLMIMTRYKYDDLWGYVKRHRPDWKVLRFPAIKDDLDLDDNRYYNPYDTRQVGEPLSPERKTLSELQKIKDNMKLTVWNSMWQQDPMEDTKASAFLWNEKNIENAHYPQDRDPSKIALELDRIVIGVDPSGSRDGDETGIVVAGKKEEGGKDIGIILADHSGHYSPDGWAKIVSKLYDKFQADLVVAEKNYGGDLVESNIRNYDNNININMVSATRGKDIRAEPVVGLYERKQVKHSKQFHTLEKQLITYEPAESGSPDRMDALVWALTELMLSNKSGTAGFF